MGPNKLKGHATILLANVIYGLNIPVTKALLDRWMTPLGYMATRTLAALLIFWIIQCFMPKERVTHRDLLIIAIGGFMGFIVSQFLTALSLQYTSPVYFSLIIALSPLCVMLLAALLLKEPVTKRKVTGVVLGIAGAVLLIAYADNDTATGSDNLLGIGLALMLVSSLASMISIQRFSPLTILKERS